MASHDVSNINEFITAATLKYSTLYTTTGLLKTKKMFQLLVVITFYINQALIENDGISKCWHYDMNCGHTLQDSEKI